MVWLTGIKSENFMELYNKQRSQDLKPTKYGRSAIRKYNKMVAE